MALSRKALPYAAAALGGAATGAVVGGAVTGKKKYKAGLSQGREEGVRAAQRYMRQNDAVRDRALRSFAVRAHTLSKQNQTLRVRLAESMAAGKRK